MTTTIVPGDIVSWETTGHVVTVHSDGTFLAHCECGHQLVTVSPTDVIHSAQSFHPSEPGAGGTVVVFFGHTEEWTLRLFYGQRLWVNGDGVRRAWMQLPDGPYTVVWEPPKDP
jgi:hypothetical protein